MYLVAVTFGVLVAVTAHELGHWLVARLLRVQVHGVAIGLGPELFGCTDRHGTRWRIGAWPIGGKCEFGSASPADNLVSCRSKAAIYFAGSASNLLLAMICAVAAGWPAVQPALLLDGAPSPETVLLILASISGSLGLFNLVPVLPMDGGLLLITVVERARGKRITEGWAKLYLWVGVAFIILTNLGLLIYLVA